MASIGRQDNLSTTDQNIPQWKRELILRRRTQVRTLPAGNSTVKLTCPTVVNSVRQAEPVEKQQHCVSSVVASNKGLPLDHVQPDFHPRGRISGESSPHGTVAVVGNMRLVEQHVEASSALVINGVVMENSNITVESKYSKMDDKQGKKMRSVYRNSADNSVVMSDNTNGKHITEEECQSDSSEELQYGPGIVNKLKCKYMSMTLRENQNRGVRPSLVNMRRAASLENILDNDELEAGKPQIKQKQRFAKRTETTSASAKSTQLPQQRYRSASRGNDSMKRARSVETLLRYDSKSNIGQVVTSALPVSPKTDLRKSAPNYMKSIVNEDIVIVESKKTDVKRTEKQKMRTSVSSEAELPPPDLVKQTLKLFENSNCRSVKSPIKTLPPSSPKASSAVPKISTTSAIHSNAQSTNNSKPILSPKPSPERILHGSPKKLPATRKLPVQSAISEKNVSPPSQLKFSFQDKPSTPPPSPRAGLSPPPVPRRKTPSPTVDSKSFHPSSPILRFESSDSSEPASISPIPGSTPIVNGCAIINALNNDVVNSDDEFDDTDGNVKVVPTKALENIRKGGMSMQFTFLTNGAISNDNSKSYLPNSKSPSPIKQTYQIIPTSPIIETKPPPVSKPVFSVTPLSKPVSVSTKPLSPVTPLPLLKSPDSPQSQGKHVALVRPMVAEKNLKNREKSAEQSNNVFAVNLKKTNCEESGLSDVGKGKNEETRNNSMNHIIGLKNANEPGLWEEKKRWNSADNTINFNFVHRKDPVPDYVPGIVLLDGTCGESTTDFDGPPSPCNVTFENDNVLINGKSSMLKQPKQTKLRISFNDAATSTYEYPSEASLLNEVGGNAEIASDSPQSASTPGTPALIGGSSSLASYTPSKVHLASEHFELGVTRTTPLQFSRPDPKPNQKAQHVEEDYLKPADDAETVAWSAETTADLLF